jgi:hypothetical protein
MTGIVSALPKLLGRNEAGSHSFGYSSDVAYKKTEVFDGFLQLYLFIRIEELWNGCSTMRSGTRHKFGRVALKGGLQQNGRLT